MKWTLKCSFILKSWNVLCRYFWKITWKGWGGGKCLKWSNWLSGDFCSNLHHLGCECTLCQAELRAGTNVRPTATKATFHSPPVTAQMLWILSILMCPRWEELSFKWLLTNHDCSFQLWVLQMRRIWRGLMCPLPVYQASSWPASFLKAKHLFQTKAFQTKH